MSLLGLRTLIVTGCNGGGGELLGPHIYVLLHSAIFHTLHIYSEHQDKTHRKTIMEPDSLLPCTSVDGMKPIHKHRVAGWTSTVSSLTSDGVKR